jgi:O-antigen/teichoic acid export membrane protein
MSEQSWLRFMPRPLVRHIEGRPRRMRVLTNVAWIFGDNVLRTGVRVVLGVWIARYLGPEQFGLLSYAIALVSIFSVFVALGLNIVVVRDLIRDPDSTNEILGTACFLQFIGSCVAFILLLVIVEFTRPNQPLAMAMGVILGSTLFIQASYVIKYWFDSRVAYKYVVWAENTGFLLASLMKLAMIVAEAPVIAFAWASLAEAALTGVALVVSYVRSNGARWRVGFARALKQLNDSWPLLVAGLSFAMYSRIDQVMLGQMRGDAEVGIYSAAVRVSEVWFFLPGAIVGSVFPSIIAAKERADGSYEKKLQSLYDAMALLGAAIGIAFTLFATPLMTLVFGAKFQQAGPVLAIYGWAGLFVGMDSAGGRYMLLEGLQRITMYRHVLGVVLNVLTNLVMIPAYGVIGSAVASTFSFVIANYLLDLFNLETRAMFVQKSRALLFHWAYTRFLGGA